MIYIEPWNLIYYPIPKCACTSIKRCICDLIKIKIDYEDQVNKKNFLDPMEEKIYCKHKKIEYLKKDLHVGDFKSFVIVRNPMDRIISCYINKVIEKKKGLQKEYYKTKNFDDFISICVDNKLPNIHINPMYTFVENKKIDFILKLENIHQDWARMFKNLGIKPTPSILHQNKSNIKNKHLNISKKTINSIYDFYKKDFEIFKYKKNLLFL